MTRDARGWSTLRPGTRIRPAEPITAARPDCALCSWTCRGYRQFEILAISRACPIHGSAECE
jgi:hypothetical protein